MRHSTMLLKVIMFMLKTVVSEITNPTVFD